MTINNRDPSKVFDDSGKIYDLDRTARIQLFGLYKVYKREKIEVVALRGLNLSVKRGECLMIVGPSGCGKTTLLNLIGGLDKPTAGKLFVDGNDITNLNYDELTRFRRENIGFVFQFMNLVKSLNAFENVELPLISLGVGGDQRKAKVDHLLEVVGLRERRLHHPSELSGGEQQRVAIATALANDPSIILADEPTGELDTKNAHEVMQSFKALLANYPEMSVIVVTHDQSLKKYADRIVRMQDGLIDESIMLSYTPSEAGGPIPGTGSGIHLQQLEAVFPDHPFLSTVKNCPQCQSSNLVITLLKTTNVEKPHELLQLRDVMIACNECHFVGKLKVKIFHP